MGTELKGRIETLRKLKEAAFLGGGKDKVDAYHQKGRLTARERINMLLDPGSFSEVGLLLGQQDGIPTEGIICGHGTINGRVVAIFAQDATILGGSTGARHGFKLYKLIERAADMRVPLIALWHSGGGRVIKLDQPDEALPEKSGDSVWYPHVQASGVIPQISAMLGPCTGLSVYCAELSDFVFMVDGISQMMLTGPRVVNSVMSEVIDMEELGGAKVHSQISGVADFRAKSEAECFELIKKLLSFLPSNNEETPPFIDTGDDANRLVNELEEIVPLNPKKTYDMKQVIAHIVDNGGFFEVKSEFAKEVIVGFGRLNGEVVGIVANQPLILAGSMTVNSSNKQARFMRFCDCFNIPIILLADTPGYLPGRDSERAGIIRCGAKVLYAHCEATVPKITVMIRKAYGGAQNGMGAAPGMGTDFVFAWVTAEAGMMGAEQSIRLLYEKDIKQADNPEEESKRLLKLYHKRYSDPFEAASLGKFAIEDVIEPRETRKRLIQALQLLKGKKKTSLYPKKHGNIPL